MSPLGLTDGTKQTGKGEYPDENGRLEYRIRLFERMVLLGCATVTMFSVFHFMQGLYTLTTFQLPLLFINIINLVFLRYHRQLVPAMNIMLGTVFIFLLGTAMIGGLANTGILWLPLYPILVFLLVGKGRGVYWVLSYNVAVFLLFVAELTGFDVTPYVADFVINVSASTLVMSFLVYIYENQREKLVDELELERVRAEEANRAKSQFLANMSHEIRTPMNGIVGLTDIMLRSDLSRESRRHAELIQTASDNLMGLIDDILEISKIEAHKVEIRYQPTELKKLVKKLVRLLKPGAHLKDIRLKSYLADNMPKYVELDPLRLGQILFNIVGNAIKFTHDGDVRLTVDIQDGDEGARMLHFKVTDTGIGIPAEKVETIFEQFSQVDSTLSRQYGGSGLGLTISRELAEMMGGSVSVSSVEGEGSTFHLYLPLKEVDAAPQSRLVTEQLPEKFAMHVLVAEDDHINQFVVTRFLNDLGCTVECVDNGVSAVDAAGTGKYDLLLMDLHMPQMDGRQATLEIRRQESPDVHLPIIALTANVISGEREACLEAGMDDFVMKPLQPERLREVLAHYYVDSGV